MHQLVKLLSLYEGRGGKRIWLSKIIDQKVRDVVVVRSLVRLFYVLPARHLASLLLLRAQCRLACPVLQMHLDTCRQALLIFLVILFLVCRVLGGV